jgi:group I intron endonuclease
MIYTKNYLNMWIYKTTNIVNNKIYIGQTRFINENYFGSGVLILNAIEKYGKENFKKEIIDSAQSQEELDEKEKFWIKEFNSQDKNIGYNIADGGWNSFTMNDDIKKKISTTLKGKYVGDKAFRKGIPLSKEHKLAISIANKNKIVSEETRKKMSDARIGNSKLVSQETKKRMSEAHKGKILSEEHKLNISKGITGRIVSESTKTKLKESNISKTQIHSIKVSAFNKENGEILSFNNLSSAARYFNKTRHLVKMNRIPGWDIQLEKPEVSIKKLRKKCE